MEGPALLPRPAWISLGNRCKIDSWRKTNLLCLELGLLEDANVKFGPPARGRYGGHQPSLSAALRAKAGGAEGIRTPDPHNAIVVLYQLSYDPSLKGATI